MPKITVVIPVYNIAKYLRKCIDSVLNQTFQDFEIILVSDGPEADDIICKEYVEKDIRISLIQNVKKGLGGARNAGIYAARGEFIAFLDSDDWIAPDFLEKMYNAMISDKDIDIVQCGTEILFEGKIDKTLKNNDEMYFAIDKTGIFDLTNDYFGNLNVGTWNKLYKMELIKKYNLFFTEKMWNEDAYFTWVYWSVCKKIYFIKDKLYKYLRRKDSLMSLARNNRIGYNVLDHFLICKFIYRFLQNNNLFQEREDAFWNLLLTSYWYLYTFANRYYLKIAKKQIADFLADKEVPSKYDVLVDLKEMKG